MVALLTLILTPSSKSGMVSVARMEVTIGWLVSLQCSTCCPATTYQHTMTSTYWNHHPLSRTIVHVQGVSVTGTVTSGSVESSVLQGHKKLIIVASLQRRDYTGCSVTPSVSKSIITLYTNELYLKTRNLKASSFKLQASSFKSQTLPSLPPHRGTTLQSSSPIN